MGKNSRFSVIIPVYNRPEEVAELLQSLETQTERDFEVIIVEDGSSLTCRDVVSVHSNRLDITYLEKNNSGPGPSRNYGAEKAKGEYLIILDSDVVVPPTYFEEISRELGTEPCDAFGGPDKAHSSFTPTQRAISYSMTSFLTTGGIRGGKKKLDKFYPRSFNMGIRREAFLSIGGFSHMRFGEDIDLSIRILKAGFSSRLFPGAWVWHKRRTDFLKFFRQVYNSGIARINLFKKYPESLKAVHLLPALFTLGSVALVLLSAVGRILMEYDDVDKWYWLCAAPWIPLILFSLAVMLDSAIRNHSLKIGFLSVAAAFVQLGGYGLGFIVAWWRRLVLGKNEFNAFENTFYK